MCFTVLQIALAVHSCTVTFNDASQHRIVPHLYEYLMSRLQRVLEHEQTVVNFERRAEFDSEDLHKVCLAY